MKTFLISFCFVFSCFVLFAQAGRVYSESGCASGGSDYYFFAGGDVVVVETVGGVLSNEYISVGTWKQNSDKSSVDIVLEYSKYIKPAPDAKIILPVGAKPEYDKYIAAYTKSDRKTKTVSIEAYGCSEYQNHAYMSTKELIDACLRNKGKRKYAFVSYRAVNEEELQKYSAEELRLMRNEIYASYGYMFKDAKLKSYFQSQGFYGNLTNVDAFLNDFEQNNIKIIQKIEKQKQ